MEKFGFVYIWRDRKKNRYYIGSHWGTETDGYICSSENMRRAYNRRKDDFKRRILSRIFTNRKDLLNEEQRYLDMIHSSEFGKKYYNVNSSVFFHSWWMNEETKSHTSQKISKIHKGKHCSPRTEFKPGVRTSIATEFKKGIIPKNKGLLLEEVVGEERSKEIKNTISRANKNQRRSKSTEFKQGMTPWNKGLKPIYITNGSINKALYGNNPQIPEGWRRGMTKGIVRG